MMSRWNVGDIPPVTADEDIDPDVEIAEQEERRQEAARNARRRLEELRDAKENQ